MSASSYGECRDHKGRVFEEGMHYVPGADSCKICICDNGHAKKCKEVLCAPPKDCKSFQLGNVCCEFICLDGALGTNNNNQERNSDFGM